LSGSFYVSSASLVEGVANASTMDGVGLALNRHRLLMRERLWQVHELRHDLSSSDLLKDVHSAAVRLGHAGEAHALLPHASWVADITTFNKRNSGEAVLIPGMLVDDLMVVLHALTATEGFRPRDGGDVRRHTSCGLAKDLDTSLIFPLELLLHLGGEGTARLGGKGDTVAGKLKLGAGEQTLARAGDITKLVVVIVSTEAAELVLHQVGSLELDPLAIKEHTDLGRLKNHNIVLGLDDLGNNVALSAHDGVPLTPWYLNGATVDLNNDILALRPHCHIGAANEDLDLLLGLR